MIIITNLQLIVPIVIFVLLPVFIFLVIVITGFELVVPIPTTLMLLVIFVSVTDCDGSAAGLESRSASVSQRDVMDDILLALAQPQRIRWRGWPGRW